MSVTRVYVSCVYVGVVNLSYCFIISFGYPSLLYVPITK